MTLLLAFLAPGSLNHTANIMRRLDIHYRVELARFAIRERIVEA